MGLELTKCRGVIKEKPLVGRLYLDSYELTYRSDIYWSVKIGKGTIATVANGKLSVRRGTKSACFEIGMDAQKWADKIINPPSRCTKLGIKPNMKFLLKGNFESAIKDELLDYGLVCVRAAASCDVVFAILNKISDLKRFDDLVESSQIGTHIWAVWPKGIEAIRQRDVIANAKSHGMGPGKGISFDEIHSAMRFTKK